MGTGAEFCPLIAKKCKRHECKFYVQIMGKNPQTGQDLNEFDCAISWLPLLLIEGAKETRQGAAAVESFRNEMVNIQSDFAQVAIDQESKRKLKEGLYPPREINPETGLSQTALPSYTVMNKGTVKPKKEKNDEEDQSSEIKQISE